MRSRTLFVLHIITLAIATVPSGLVALVRGSRSREAFVALMVGGFVMLASVVFAWRAGATFLDGLYRDDGSPAVPFVKGRREHVLPLLFVVAIAWIIVGVWRGLAI